MIKAPVFVVNSILRLSQYFCYIWHKFYSTPTLTKLPLWGGQKIHRSAEAIGLKPTLFPPLPVPRTWHGQELNLQPFDYNRVDWSRKLYHWATTSVRWTRPWLGLLEGPNGAISARKNGLIWKTKSENVSSRWIKPGIEVQGLVRVLFGATLGSA